MITDFSYRQIRKHMMNRRNYHVHKYTNQNKQADFERLILFICVTLSVNELSHSVRCIKERNFHTSKEVLINLI
jgi:hypothetical protein